MAESDEITITKNKLKKYVTGAILTVFLGAVGSGLWERFFSPIWDNISVFLLRSISFFFHGYVNILHQDIGKAQIDQFIMLPYIACVVTIVAFPWLLLFAAYKLSSIKKNSEKIIESSSGMKKKHMYIVIIAMNLIITLMYGATFLQDSYTRRACIFVERSIEIVTPHITQQRFLQLRASYRNVDDAEKFYALEEELRSIAARNKVILPEFTVIR